MPDDDGDEVAAAFNTWQTSQSENPQILFSDGVELYRGPQVCKSASVRIFGDLETGKVAKREFRVRTVLRKEFEPGYDFADPDRWTIARRKIR